MRNSRSSASSPNSPAPPPPLPGSDAFETEIRVRYSEVDRMGVAHNKHYLEWFELGRTEFCRSKGVPYPEIEERGYYLVVVEAFCRYKKPLHYDDVALVRVALAEMTPRKFVFLYEIIGREDRLLRASGRTVHLVVNGRSELSALPEDLLGRLGVACPGADRG